MQQGLQINMDGKNFDGLIKFLKDYSINNIVNYPDSSLQWIWRVGRDQSMCDSLGHGRSLLYSLRIIRNHWWILRRQME